MAAEIGRLASVDGRCSCFSVSSEGPLWCPDAEASAPASSSSLPAIDWRDNRPQPKDRLSFLVIGHTDSELLEQPTGHGGPVPPFFGSTTFAPSAAMLVPVSPSACMMKSTSAFQSASLLFQMASWARFSSSSTANLTASVALASSLLYSPSLPPWFCSEFGRAGCAPW